MRVVGSTSSTLACTCQSCLRGTLTKYHEDQFDDSDEDEEDGDNCDGDFDDDYHGDEVDVDDDGTLAGSHLHRGSWASLLQGIPERFSSEDFHLKVFIKKFSFSSISSWLDTVKKKSGRPFCLTLAQCVCLKIGTPQPQQCFLSQFYLLLSGAEIELAFCHCKGKEG